jgi:hypothetical protein
VRGTKNSGRIFSQDSSSVNGSNFIKDNKHNLLGLSPPTQTSLATNDPAWMTSTVQTKGNVYDGNSSIPEYPQGKQTFNLLTSSKRGSSTAAGFGSQSKGPGAILLHNKNAKSNANIVKYQNQMAYNKQKEAVVRTEIGHIMG